MKRVSYEIQRRRSTNGTILIYPEGLFVNATVVKEPLTDWRLARRPPNRLVRVSVMDEHRSLQNVLRVQIGKSRGVPPLEFLLVRFDIIRAS